ncbi:MAG TPA: hypothetical protein VGL59_21345 [Polyangia bacterium]|jgi:hypothetical protein
MPAPARRSRAARAPRLAVFLAVLGALAVGCGYNPHFQSGITKCATSGQPCPSGFTCDSKAGVCVADDGGVVDAPVDEPTGGPDTGDNDSSGSGDEGPPDAAGGSGGTIDASADAADTSDAGAPVDSNDAACTADIATSPTNCGACGHSCGGGLCDRGVCQPYVLPGVAAASSIAVDASLIYFTSGTKVSACPKSGCVLQPTQLDDMGNGGYDTWSVVVTNGSLFFMSAPTQPGTEHDDLFMCPLTGCPAPAPTIATARFGVGYETNAGNDVYWSDQDAKKTYRRACLPNAGTCDVTVTIIPEGLDQRALAARSDEFYFVDALGLQECPYAGCSGTLPTATGATLLTALIPTAVIYFNGLIYMQFGDQQHTLNGAIRTCTPGDCDAHTPKNFIINHDVIDGLAVDANGVYWMEDMNLYSCPLTGCVGGAKKLASNITGPSNSGLSAHLIVTDDAFVYWIDDVAGTVKRIAK